MTDEEYVRSVWESVNWGASDYAGKEFGVIVYDDKEGTGFRADSQPNAWSAAAEFTRERLEQIRQVENEVATMADMCEFSRNLLKINADYVEAVRDLCCNSRILAREQAALAGLKQGMK